MATAGTIGTRLSDLRRRGNLRHHLYHLVRPLRLDVHALETRLPPGLSLRQVEFALFEGAQTGGRPRDAVVLHDGLHLDGTVQRGRAVAGAARSFRTQLGLLGSDDGRLRWNGTKLQISYILNTVI